MLIILFNSYYIMSTCTVSVVPQRKTGFASVSQGQNRPDRRTLPFPSISTPCIQMRNEERQVLNFTDQYQCRCRQERGKKGRHTTESKLEQVCSFSCNLCGRYSCKLCDAGLLTSVPQVSASSSPVIRLFSMSISYSVVLQQAIGA